VEDHSASGIPPAAVNEKQSNFPLTLGGDKYIDDPAGDEWRVEIDALKFEMSGIHIVPVCDHLLLDHFYLIIENR